MLLSMVLVVSAPVLVTPGEGREGRLLIIWLLLIWIS